MATEYFTAVGAETLALYGDASAGTESLRHYLNGKGYQVVHAESPQALIELTRRNLADVVILMLSDMFDETEMCHALKEGVDPPSIIAVCERGTAAELEQAPAAASCLDHIFIKPAPFAQLLDEIERRLNHRTLEQGDQPKPGELTFPSLLVELSRAERTGRLVVTAKGVQTTIYWRKGRPVFAEQGSLGETLGRMLLRTGKITQEQFSKAVELITSRIVDSEQMRLGEALVALGFLTAEEVLEALKEQVKRKIIACFAWRRIHADFKEGEEHLANVGDFSQPAEAVLVEGVKTIGIDELERHLGPKMSRHVRLQSSAWKARGRLFGLTGQEQSLLQELSGRWTVQHICECSKLDRFHARQILVALMLAEMLEFAETPFEEEEEEEEEHEPPSASRTDQTPVRRAVRPSQEMLKARSAAASVYLRVQGQPDHQVLQVDENASSEQIRTAYRRQTDEVETIATSPDAEPETRQTVGAIRLHLRQARDRLLSGQRGSKAKASKGTEPASPMNRGHRLEAEQAFQRGRQSLTRQDLKDALGAFEEAAKLHPEAVEYAMCSAWVSYLSSNDKEQAKLGKRANRLAARVYQHDPSNAVANLVLGHFLRKDRRFERAQRHLLIAGEQDSELKDVETELMALERQRRGEAEKPPRKKRPR